MDDFNSETDSDYTSYWRDWVSGHFFRFCAARFLGKEHMENCRKETDIERMMVYQDRNGAVSWFNTHISGGSGILYLNIHSLLSA